MQKLADDLAAVERLALAGDDAGLDQVDDGVGEHLGVDAQVLLVLEELEHGLGDAADAELDRRAVLDQGGDVLADLPGVVVRLAADAPRSAARRPARGRRCRGREMQESPMRPRHLRVDLGDDQRGVLGGALDDVDRDAEAAHAVLVGRGDLDQRHVQRQLAGGEQPRDVRQEDRRVVAQPFLDDVADVFGDEEAVDAEMTRRAPCRRRARRRRSSRWTISVSGSSGRPGRQRLDQLGRLAQPVPMKTRWPGWISRHGGVRRHDHLLVLRPASPGS